MTARFITSDAKVTIIQYYSPPNDHENAEKDDYQELQEVVNNILQHDLAIFIGDMNAEIGRDRSGFK